MISAGTALDADAPVSADVIEWADVAVAFEFARFRRLARRLRPLLWHARVIVLDVPDDFSLMDPAFVQTLRQWLPARLGVDETSA